MPMTKNVGVISKIGAGVLVLALFVGCDLFKKKETSKEGAGVTLLSIGGKAVINEGDFNKHLVRMLQMNPYFRGAGVESLPLPVKRKVFDELAKQELILAEAYKNKIDETEEFKKSFAEMAELVKKSLLVQQFEKNLLEAIKIEENEVKADFDKNKDKYVKDVGGVAVSGIKFDTDLKANAFLNKVRGKFAEFNDLAKKENAANFTDFGRVGEEMRGMPMNNVPAEIKKKALAFTKFPSIDKIQSGKTFWVVYAADKKGKEFFAMEEIKPQLESMLKNNKFRAALEEKLATLKGDYKPEINESYFNPEAAKAAEAPKAEGSEATPEVKEVEEEVEGGIEEVPATEAKTAA
jgi:peptidyl-prolyl cis-trans isomerase C